MKDLVLHFWRSHGALYRIVRIILSVVVFGLVLLMTFEDKLIYFPTRYPDGYWTVRENCEHDGEILPAVEDSRFSTSDGVALHGWYCSPLRCQDGKGLAIDTKIVVLWFHGNAGNISYRYDMIRAMMDIPVQVFIIDYRGYGKSEGTPSEKGLYLDAQAAWDYLISVRKIEPQRIVILGKSLGGVPAIDLATRVKPAGLIVQSSFTSASDMAKRIMPFLPRFLLHTRMDSINKIVSVQCPKLFIHSRADEIVPYELGQKLFEAACEPKEFYEVKGSPHNSTYLIGGKPYLAALRRFIESVKQ
ncbi:MAG TPA: alpha/beta hydrolase [Blastocatellia bacterium]|nr:alpha/beta hydrolase [Blastocatellia bacterium]